MALRKKHNKRAPRIAPLARKDAPHDIAALYDEWFGEGRDPVADPGTGTGTPGDWWTTWAQAPEILHAMRAYLYKNSPLDPKLREVALIRTGYARASQFVFSQHCKGARRIGLEEEKIRAIPFWTISNAFTPAERAILAYVDGLVLEGGRVHNEVFAALRQALTEKEVLILTYLVNLYNMHGISSRALRLEYDDVPERVVEIPRPEEGAGGVQDWTDPKWAKLADEP